MNLIYGVLTQMFAFANLSGFIELVYLLVLEIEPRPYVLKTRAHTVTPSLTLSRRALITDCGLVNVSL